MRVLHLVSTSTLTGPADPALMLARAQRHQQGLDAWIAFDRVRGGNMTEKAEEACVPVLEALKLCTAQSFLSALSDRARLKRLASEFDVIHAHTSHDHALAALARGRARLIRTIHHPRSAAKRGVQGLAYARTDGFVLIAGAHRETLLASYPRIDRTRTAVIVGAVDLQRFRPGVGGEAFRTRYGIAAGAFVLGMISRIKEGRRHDRVLEAFARASEDGKGRPMRLALIGSGEGEPSVKRRIDELGLGGRVVFYGFRDRDLPEAISSANATILLSEGNDAGCRAVLESLAVGVPVIGGRHPAIVEALEGSPAGVLVDPDDLDAIAGAISRMASLNGADAAALGARARERAVERYSEERRASEVLAFYERVSRMEAA
jgi:glycosyltransferase involved in cell wall biosynthesis